MPRPGVPPDPIAQRLAPSPPAAQNVLCKEEKGREENGTFHSLGDILAFSHDYPGRVAHPSRSEGWARDSSDPSGNPPSAAKPAHTPPLSPFPAACSPFPAYHPTRHPARTGAARRSARMRDMHTIFDIQTATPPLLRGYVASCLRGFFPPPRESGSRVSFSPLHNRRLLRLFHFSAPSGPFLGRPTPPRGLLKQTHAESKHYLTTDGAYPPSQQLSP